VGDPGHPTILTVISACAKLLHVSPLSSGFEAADDVSGRDSCTASREVLEIWGWTTYPRGSNEVTLSSGTTMYPLPRDSGILA
jgi:hypothetical protein